MGSFREVISINVLFVICEWCDFKYSRIVDKIINMTNEEIKLRNITIEDKLKEMEENLD